MLITKTVNVKWNANTKNHYVSKGYTYTNIGEEFKINVEDLPSGSSAKVIIECDGCNKIITNTRWHNYNKSIKDDGKYYCDKCIKKFHSTEKMKKTKLENSKSFEQWCLENNCQDILDRWDYELNKYNPREVNYGTRKKYWFKCPKKLHNSELKNISHFTCRQIKDIYCKSCNSFAQYLIDSYGENALELYWDYSKNKTNPWEINKGTDRLYVWLKCQQYHYHENYKITPNHFISGSRCPFCKNSDVYIHPFDSLGALYPETLVIWSNKNMISPFEYSPKSSKKVWWKCTDGKHEDYFRDIDSSSKYNFRCPQCSQERNESFLQEKVRLYLENLHSIILHEYDCTIIPKNPKTRRKMPYDNEIVELKLIIEVHGEQHYKKKNGYYKGRLWTRQLYDRYKRMYAKSKGYKYLEIPYWTDNAKEEWKQLIDNKIKEILNKQIN